MAGEMPTRTRERVAGIGIQKGKLNNQEVKLVSWDAVPACDPEACPIVDNCSYQKQGRCTLRLKYQQHVVDAVLSGMKDVTEEQMLIIGMHLIPLYTQLIQVKMHLLNSPTMVVGRGGCLAANPLLKEQRAIIKDISACLRELKELGQTGTPRAPKDLGNGNERGNPDYYTQLTGEV